ncbi:MAG: hypothetical protein CL765_00815, partial [Chloroflexi bacterium]|nr:hypothetical protein [Chloroflexota bacterium]
ANEGGIDSDVEKAVEAAEQEMEIVKAGAEEVLAEKDVLEIAQRDCQMQAYSFKRQKDGRSPQEFIRDCMTEATANISSSGDIDSDVEKAVEAAEQEMEIVKAGAEEVLAEREIMEAAQIRCQQDFYDPSKRRGKPRTIFINDCMREAASNSGEAGDIDSDIEKAVEAAEQEMEIVKAGAEEVLAEREIMETAQTRCYADSLVPRKRRGIPLDAFMAQCISKAASASGVTGDIDFYINKAVEAAQQEMAVAKAEADRAEEEREVIRTATRLCQRDSLDASKRKGKPRNDFINDCIRESAANRDGSGEIDSDIEKEVETAEQELDIVKAGAEEVFEERVASLEEKVAELTELLEALQTQ